MYFCDHPKTPLSVHVCDVNIFPRFIHIFLKHAMIHRAFIIPIHSAITAQTCIFGVCLSSPVSRPCNDLITTLDKKYFISFLSRAKMLTLMIILNATVCSTPAWGIWLCPYLKSKLMLLKKLLNSGSSRSNQFSLEPLVALTYLFLGWSHGLLTTMPLLRHFHWHRLAAVKRLFWANTHRQRGIKWEDDFQNCDPTQRVRTVLHQKKTQGECNTFGSSWSTDVQ